jgi:hypothetical protein
MGEAGQHLNCSDYSSTPPKTVCGSRWRCDPDRNGHPAGGRITDQELPLTRYCAARKLECPATDAGSANPGRWKRLRPPGPPGLALGICCRPHPGNRSVKVKIVQSWPSFYVLRALCGFVVEILFQAATRYGTLSLRTVFCVMHNVAMTQFSRLGFGVSQVGEGARTSAELAPAVVGRDTAFDAESAERGAGRAEQYFAGAALATPPHFRLGAYLRGRLRGSG